MTHTTPTHKLFKESIHLSPHIEETKKGTHSLYTYHFHLTALYQVHAIALLSRLRLLGLETRVAIRSGWNLRAAIPAGVYCWRKTLR